MVVKWMKVIEGGICAPRGFLANGVACGIKKSGRPDLALIYSEVPARAAAVFTTNRFFGHHITLDKMNLRSNQAQAILINSGNANCGVGKSGLIDAQVLTEAMAKILGIEPKLVLMASTGIIGRRLPIEKMKSAFGDLVKTKDKAHLAAQAIMTTDKKTKEMAVELEMGGKKIRIGAMAKGAGMISPHMATMLCFITSDVDVSIGVLKKLLSRAVESSFNRISIDGQMSTNDTVIIMANGLAKNKKITSLNSKGSLTFSQALNYVCRALAKQIVLDGEGATKFIEIKVKGAKTHAQAQKIARKIANSTLFKASMYGENPNWGRIMAALGSSGVKVNPDKLEVSFRGISVCKNGCAVEANIKHLRDILSEREITVNIDLHQGRAEGFIWTCDLSEEYVHINAHYE